MPWCGACSRFLSPSTVRHDGTCPGCGATVDPGRARRPGTPPRERPARPLPPEDEPGPVPWHLRVTAGALAVYLGYRFLQGLEWVWRRLGAGG